MKKMLLVLFIGLLLAGLFAKAQTMMIDSAKKINAEHPAIDTVPKKPVEKPIGDSVEYITNEDMKGIYRYISDRTSGTQYFEIFLVLDRAIQEAKKKAADRYRKKKKDK